MMIEAAARDAFRPTADPYFFWRHGQYENGFDRLRAAVLAGGRVALLTGEPGTGKTTLANVLAQELRADGAIVGRLLYGRLEVPEAWSAMAGALNLEGLDSRDAFEDRGRTAFRAVCSGASAALLIVDEAHTLGSDALIELERLARVLSAGARPVLSLLLVGLPELRARLESPECHGLAERIGTEAELTDLSPGDVASYIRHRLEIASANPELLPADVVDRVATASHGTPARINQMCLALVAGSAAAPPAASPPARGVFPWPRARIGLVAAGVLAAGLAAFATLHSRNTEPPPPAVVAPAEPVTPPAAGPVSSPPADAGTPPAADSVASPAGDAGTSPTAGAVRPPVVDSGAPPPAAVPVPSSAATAPEPVPPRAGPPASPPRAQVTARPRATPPARAPTTPQRQGEQPDASDVIDWLLKEGAGKR